MDISTHKVGEPGTPACHPGASLCSASPNTGERRMPSGLCGWVGRGPELRQQQGDCRSPATPVRAQPLGTVELQIQVHSRNVSAGQSLGQLPPAYRTLRRGRGREEQGQYDQKVAHP